MRFQLRLAIATLAACLCWGCAGQAQNNAAPATKNEAVVHTVAPAEYSVSKGAGVTSRVVPEEESLAVTGTDAKEAITLNLGWMEVEPNTAYRGRYRVRAASLSQTTGIYLMIREHKKKDERPITPYHKTSVRERDLKPEEAREWQERALNFTTGAETHALSGAIVITGLKGELRFSAFELLDSARLAELNRAATEAATQQERAQALAESEKLLAQIRAEAATRAPLTPRPLVFSRSQMKYGLERNYYHQWNDRPLLVNREYRMPSPYIVTLPSYKRILEEVVKYDIDGLAFFPETRGRMDVFEFHEKAGMPGVQIIPEFIGSNSDAAVQMKLETLQRALKSPSAARINGKVLITSYGAQSLTPAQWKELLSTLRAQVGDTFLFLPALTNVVSLRGPFSQGEPITREAIEKEKAYLRSYLDVCDGIYFNYPAAFRNKDRSFDDAFYREVFIPLFKSVLSEPAYRHKYLGLSAYRSHMSPERGNSLHEDGTRTLRASFEAVMEARPDVIILPEWDEQNENTSFRPTVYGSRSSERILRYYMSRIKDKAPTPLPGDDLNVPNLIFSARKSASLGEKLMFELLNVPDSTTPAPYSVALTLQDADGKVVRAFDPVEFDAAQLQEHRLYLATETVPQARALVPVLTVRGYKGRDLVFDSGFHSVKLRATWNWDHLYVKQPLRGLLRPATAQLSWETPATPGAPLVLTGSVTSPEELNLVEVLGDDDEAYAVDPQDEFFRGDPTRDLFLIEYRALNNLEMSGTLTLKNANAEWLTNGTPLHQQETEAEVKGNQIQLSTPVSVHQRWIYLAIPKADIARAELDFNFDKAKFSVPLREVLEKKMIARHFAGGLHISLQPYHRQIDMPSPLKTKQVSFRVQIWPEIATEEYHLRLTSLSGKLFRSRPLLLPSANDAAAKTLRVYSDEKQRGVDVQVATHRIPDLRYDFDPERGAVLLTPAGRPFWATLGGFTNTTTGRGTINSLFHNKYPASVERSAPQWVSEDGAPCLEFDGKGTYLELPREALPWRGAFTISFDVKPNSAQNQALLANGTVGRQTGLTLEIRDGKLWASFMDADWKVQRFPTSLNVPAKAWSSIGVRYDFENLALSVNGKTESFPLALPASNIGFTLVGVGWRGPWFAGHLRNLRIVHNAENL